MKNEIILFENQNVKLEVNMKDETVWLNTNQMSELFGREESNIRRHIINVFRDKELYENNNVQKMHVDGVKQLVPFYSLDVIISVGYRVKSQNGVVFRKWANKILKDYMLKGYAVNQKRLEYLEKTIKLIDIAGRIDTELKGSEAKDLIKVINNYSNALNLLDDYDHKRMAKPDGTTNNNKMTYEDCINIVSKLKFNNDSDLFALERDKELQLPYLYIF